eukprot:363552-Chlamydomonas_euryale.AAC.2
MDGWMHGCMDAWMDGWVGGWMDGWVGREPGMRHLAGRKLLAMADNKLLTAVGMMHVGDSERACSLELACSLEHACSLRLECNRGHACSPGPA